MTASKQSQDGTVFQPESAGCECVFSFRVVKLVC
jgi:hypothetical protein